MTDINKAITEAFKLAEDHTLDMNGDSFARYGPIYVAPTSNVRDTVALYKDCKKVLTSGSCGAYAFELLLNGAREIDCFDKNVLQKMYFNLMKEAIINLDYVQFICYFTINFHSLLSADLFDRIAHTLDSETLDFWSPLYDYYFDKDLVSSTLFRRKYRLGLDHLKTKSSIYSLKDYNRLQSILRSEDYSLSYTICEIEDLPKQFKGNHYDLICLDNILQYYETIPILNTPYLVNKFVKKDLSSILNDEGKIQVNYGFQFSDDALKYYLKEKPLTNDRIRRNDINNEIKSGIIISLLKKYDDYEYQFIPGVESEDIENVVLTYTKHK